MRSLLSILLFVLVILSCEEKQSIETNQTNIDSLSYAELFQIENGEGYKKLTVFNPWKDRSVYKTYYLVSKSAKTLPQLPEDAVIIKTPVNRISTMSATHIGLLDKLGELESIIGHSSSDYIYNERLKARMNENKVTVTGAAQSLNLEAFIELNPDVLMNSVYDKIHNNLILVEQSGIPVAYNIEWMEAHPLARAEWIKFMALFYEKEALADSIFDDIEKSYLSTKYSIEPSNHQPSVLVSYKYKGTWFMPGGQSDQAALFRAAGIDYHYYSDSSTGSVPLSFETVIEEMTEADIWIKPGATTSIKELLALDERYGQFKALQEGEMYNVHAQIAENGANNYWEQGMIEPHLILKDLVKIFHPKLLPEYELTYYKKMDS